VREADLASSARSGDEQFKRPSADLERALALDLPGNRVKVRFELLAGWRGALVLNSSWLKCTAIATATDSVTHPARLDRVGCHVCS
jgi:hypothetical protein